MEKMLRKKEKRAEKERVEREKKRKVLKGGCANAGNRDLPRDCCHCNVVLACFKAILVIVQMGQIIVTISLCRVLVT